MEGIQLFEGREREGRVIERKKTKYSSDGWEQKIIVFVENLLCAGGFLKQRGGLRQGEEKKEAPDTGNREKRERKGIFRVKTKKIGQTHAASLQKPNQQHFVTNLMKSQWGQ